MKPAQPLIAIPCRHETSSDYFDEPVNAQSEAYLNAITEVGGIPLMLPLNLDPPAMRTLYDLADGVLLSGGGDIDPALYGREPGPILYEVQPDRDRVELLLSAWAAEDGKPLLGICRGIQVMAVAVGGALCQDLPTEKPDAACHIYDYLSDEHNTWTTLAHEVELQPASRLAGLLQTGRLWVNSLHHQAIEHLPAPLQVVGCSTDGVIEAIERPDHPFYCGVQWHPEVLVVEHETARRLFRGFVAACLGRR